MSILSKNNNSNMGSSSFHEFKKQASFFFKEKMKTARLALTDVTPAELLTEEATNGNPWAPDSITMRSISRAAFEVDDYWRIVAILHKRFSKFERTNWRVSYNSLVLLEHLLTHGPESVSGEFQSDGDVIREMGSFQFIDEKGFNWGLAVQKKSERILKLLEKGPLLKQERDRARKLTREIQGFGSFCLRSSGKGILQESSRGTFDRCNSQFTSLENEDNQLSIEHEGGGSVQKGEKVQQRSEHSCFESGDRSGNLSSWSSFNEEEVLQNVQTQTSLKKHMVPREEELHRWSFTGESNPLVDSMTRNEEIGIGNLVEDDHPFTEIENQTGASLISARGGIMTS